MNIKTLVKNYLLDKKEITNFFFDNNNNKYNNKEYELIIQCNTFILNKEKEIKICIPFDWEVSLIDIFILNDIPFIPHVERNGKLCLYDLEGTLIDSNLIGVLNQCINKAIDIIEKGLNNENSEDFIEEFDNYLILNDDLISANCYLDFKNINELNFFEKVDNNRKIYYLSDKLSCDKMTKITTIFLKISTNEIIYPHNYNESVLTYLNNLLSKTELSNIQINKIHNKRKVVIIFSISQKNGLINNFGFYITNYIFDICNKIFEFGRIKIILINFMNRRYLLNRVAHESNMLENSKILLIGCGSIGSYVFDNLIHSGINDITLLDYDSLTKANIYRHLLGISYVGLLKTEGLKYYGNKMIPQLKISCLNDKIQNVLLKDPEIFNNYDYIISTTGDMKINRWMNKLFYKKTFKLKVFYLWNEPLDIGSHIAYIDYNNPGCLNCLFKRDENKQLYDSYSYCEKNQLFTINESGCGGTFIPYGSILSKKTSLLFMSVLIDVIKGNINSNMLISEKNTDYFFKLKGYKVSKEYLKQKEKIKYISAKKFKNMNCEVCSYDDN